MSYDRMKLLEDIKQYFKGYDSRFINVMGVADLIVRINQAIAEEEREEIES